MCLVVCWFWENIDFCVYVCFVFVFTLMCLVAILSGHQRIVQLGEVLVDLCWWEMSRASGMAGCYLVIYS